MVAKIDNVDARQNHTGLAVADIVFEEIVEGRATRFAAVFHSQSADPHRTDPVRSHPGHRCCSRRSTRRCSCGAVATRRHPGDRRVDAGQHEPEPRRGLLPRPRVEARTTCTTATDAIWLQTPPDHPGPPPEQYFQYLRPDETFTGDAVGGMSRSRRQHRGRLDVERRDGQVRPVAERHARTSTRPTARSRRRTSSSWVSTTSRALVDRNSPEAQTIGEGPVFVFSDGKVIEGRWKRDSASTRSSSSTCRATRSR